jgi:hypothetical protein
VLIRSHNHVHNINRRTQPKQQGSLLMMLVIVTPTSACDVETERDTAALPAEISVADFIECMAPGQPLLRRKKWMWEESC